VGDEELAALVQADEPFDREIQEPAHLSLVANDLVSEPFVSLLVSRIRTSKRITIQRSQNAFVLSRVRGYSFALKTKNA